MYVKDQISYNVRVSAMPLFQTSAWQDADVEPGGLGVGGEGVQVDDVRDQGWSSFANILTLC